MEICDKEEEQGEGVYKEERPTINECRKESKVEKSTAIAKLSTQKRERKVLIKELLLVVDATKRSQFVISFSFACNLWPIGL